MSREEERKAVAAVYYNQSVKGDSWYVISRKWWQLWCSYTGFELNNNPMGDKVAAADGDKPPQMDNSELALMRDGKEYGELKPDLVDRQDYELIHESVWKILHARYGGSGPVFKRVVITKGLRQTEVVELYPQYLRVYVADPESGEAKTSKVVSFSREQAFEDVLRDFQEDKKSPRDGRVWVKRVKESDKMSDDEPSGPGGVAAPSPVAAPKAEEKVWTLVPQDQQEVKFENLQLASLEEVLLDYKTAEGVWSKRDGSKKNWQEFEVNDQIDAKDSQGKWYQGTIREVKPEKLFVHFDGWESKYDEWIPKVGDRLAPKNTHTQGAYVRKSRDPYDSYTSSYSLYSANDKGKPPEKGAVGLRNLGNTCFMNSTLQCLSNSPGLTEYFIDRKYKQEINFKNPLGWQGRIATSYGDLLSEMWSGEYRSVAPRTFKEVIGEFQPRFSGYQQHDSSELLSFLLDGLHEDLNRVKEKPYTQAVESKGRADLVVARESWHRHLLRNQSVIVDMFQGQLRSRVVCPDCKTESITFDPFMFLSVPLPGLDYSMQPVTFMPAYNPEDHKGSQPRQISVKCPKYGSIKDFKEATAQIIGVPANQLLVVEVWKNKVYRALYDNQSIGFQKTDDIWVWHLPQKSEMTSPSEPKYVEVQIAVHYMVDPKHFKVIGAPIITLFPRELIRACPISKLRAILRNALTPFLKDGWKQGETDAGLYLIEVMDNGCQKCRKEMNPKTIDESDKEKEMELNLSEISTTPTPGFGIFFVDEKTKNERYVDPKQLLEGGGAGGGGAPKRDAVTLAACIDSLTSEEVLPESEAYFCAKCKKHKCATKKFDLWMLPDVLIIHLKRFSYTRHWRDKIETDVDFPLEGLDMSKWVINADEKKESVYDCYAVSNHFGSLGGGHYTAYVKNLLNGKWYNMDDSSVTPVHPDAVKSRAAYVLFYHRKKKKAVSHRPDDYKLPAK